MRGGLAPHRYGSTPGIGRIQGHFDAPPDLDIAQVVANHHVIILFKTHGSRTAQTQRGSPGLDRIDLREQAIGRNGHVQHRVRFQEISADAPQIHIGGSQVKDHVGQHRRAGIAHRLQAEQECLHVLAPSPHEVLCHRLGIDPGQSQRRGIDRRDLDGPAVGHGTVGGTRLDELESHLPVGRLAHQTDLRVCPVRISPYPVLCQGVRTRVDRKDMRGGIGLERLEAGADHLPCHSRRERDLAVERIPGICAVLPAIIVEHQRAVHQHLAVLSVLQLVHIRQQDLAFRVGIPDGVTALQARGQPAPGRIERRAAFRLGIDVGAKPNVIRAFFQERRPIECGLCRSYRAFGNLLQGVEFRRAGHVQVSIFNSLLAPVLPVGGQPRPRQLIQGAENLHAQSDHGLLADTGHQVPGSGLEACRRVDVENRRLVLGQQGLEAIAHVIGRASLGFEHNRHRTVCCLGTQARGRSLQSGLFSIVFPKQFPVSAAAINLEHIGRAVVRAARVKVEKTELDLGHPAFRDRHKGHDLFPHVGVVGRIRGRCGAETHRILVPLDVFPFLAVINVFHLDRTGLRQGRRRMATLAIAQRQTGANGAEIVPVLGIIADGHGYVEIIAAFQKPGFGRIYLHLSRVLSGQVNKAACFNSLGGIENGILPHGIDFAAFHKA